MYFFFPKKKKKTFLKIGMKNGATYQTTTVINICIIFFLCLKITDTYQQNVPAGNSSFISDDLRDRKRR